MGTGGAGSGAVEQQIALAGILRKRGGALELSLGFGEVPELEKKVAANAKKQAKRLLRTIHAAHPSFGAEKYSVFNTSDKPIGFVPPPPPKKSEV